MSITVEKSLEIFGLSTLDGQGLKSLKSIYHAKAMSLHPDRGGSAEDFIELRNAYSKLKASLSGYDSDKNNQEKSVDYEGYYYKSQEVVKKYESIFNNQIKSISITRDEIDRILDECNNQLSNLNTWMDKQKDVIYKKHYTKWWQIVLPLKKLTRDEYLYYNNELIKVYNEEMQKINDEFRDQVISGYKKGLGSIIDLLNDY